jgi:hypothetical protein
MLSREYTHWPNPQAATAARRDGFRLVELLPAIFENR